MTCYHPISAWQNEGGEVVFTERGGGRALTFPCGQCVGCRLERSRVWAMRCVHESSCHEFSSFVTLTYEDNPISLRYADFQKFMKRLRKAYGPVRFFMCGEYGEQMGRPHYHALLFGVFFHDRVLHSERNGFRLYRSESLDKLWTHGFASIGDVTFESAAYVARYIMKKVTGDAASDHYKRMVPETGEIVELVPEFCRMSLKPGIGYNWFARWSSDVFSGEKDGVPINGIRVKPPRYYKDLLAEQDWNLSEDIDYRRYVRSDNGKDDRTEERLAVREQVAKARLKFYKREI